MSKVKLPKTLGMLLLAIWLIVMGLVQALNLGFTGLSILMGILAIAAGILILLRR
jgi:thiol:disulfide interchange protein